MSIRVRQLSLPCEAAVRAAMTVINNGDPKIALVVAADGRLAGTVTDGDIRRGFLRGLTLESPITEVMFRRPLTVRRHECSPYLSDVMRERDLRAIPVVDDAGRVIDVVLFSDYLAAAPLDNPVVVMAGGEGRRLRPLTEYIPKPMLLIGGRPILETVLGNFVHQGLTDITLSVNYRANVIKDHFGDGGRYGACIRYLEELEPLGTAGALRLLPERSVQPLIVVNGDVLTTLDYRQMLKFHTENGARITVGAQRYQQSVPFGVFQINDGRVLAVQEKPVYEHFINSGIYILDPGVLDLLPPSGAFDMPQLIDLVLGRNEPVGAFPIWEYWLDVGRMDDFQQAHRDFEQIFGGTAGGRIGI
jgi:dTDP-glucose pyrophosphorylase